MKRNVCLFMLTALTLSFTACGSDDGDEFMDPVRSNKTAQKTVVAKDSVAAQDTIVVNDPNVIKPITDVDRDVKAFFSTLSMGAVSWPHLNVSENPMRDTCIVINSEEELIANYDYHSEWGGMPIPTIDFTKYTIIVGQHEQLPEFNFLTSQQIRKEEDGLVLELFITDYSETDIACFEYFGHFGALYPKLDGDIVRIKKTISHP